jgi:glycosyltransferase involved in cell wall biosynthesis
MLILHVIAGLNNGGAEGVLHRLVVADRKNVHHVVSLSDEGSYGSRLASAGIVVDALHMQGRTGTVRSLSALYRIIRTTAPDVVQTWMYHADLIGGVVARLAGIPTVVWGIRNCRLDVGQISSRTRRIARVCAAVSSWLPKQIVSCSEEAASVHAALGYDRNKIVVISNGYDLSRFAPDAAARNRLRTQWGLAEETFLLGMVARWDPQKDHANLVAALALVRAARPEGWACVLAGPGMEEKNPMLMQLVSRHPLGDRIQLLGPRTDVPEVLNALDLHVLSSCGEAFPNALAEAMACAVPCVTTDVGDAVQIVGSTGWIVPPSNADLLARGITQAMTARRDETAWRERQQAARARIGEHFPLHLMVERFRAIWRQAADQPENPK